MRAEVERAWDPPLNPKSDGFWKCLLAVEHDAHGKRHRAEIFLSAEDEKNLEPPATPISFDAADCGDEECSARRLA